MSILIRGMEMPKGCLLCRFFDPIHEVCLGMERAEKTILSDKYKHPACPLVEVPERKRGKWKFDVVAQYDLSYGGRIYIPEYRCNQCGHYYESYVRWDEPKIPEDADFPNFCENCGVIMDGMDGDSDV